MLKYFQCRFFFRKRYTYKSKRQYTTHTHTAMHIYTFTVLHALRRVRFKVNKTHYLCQLKRSSRDNISPRVPNHPIKEAATATEHYWRPKPKAREHKRERSTTQSIKSFQCIIYGMFIALGNGSHLRLVFFPSNFIDARYIQRTKKYSYSV